MNQKEYLPYKLQLFLLLPQLIWFFACQNANGHDWETRGRKPTSTNESRQRSSDARARKEKEPGFDLRDVSKREENITQKEVKVTKEQEFRKEVNPTPPRTIGFPALIDGCKFNKPKYPTPSKKFVVDKQGNIYFSCVVNKSLRIAKQTVSSSQSTHIFMMKASPKGDILWSKVFPTDASAEKIRVSLNTDKQGNLLWFGTFHSTRMKLTIGTKILRGVGQKDSFLAKFDPQGNLLWTQYFGGYGSEFRGITARGDAHGNVVVVGQYKINQQGSSVSFGTKRLTAKWSSWPPSYPVVGKFNTVGELLWVKTYPSASALQNIRVTTDHYSNIYIGANFDSLINIGVAYANQGDDDIFLLKLSPSGKRLWSQVIATEKHESLEALDTDGQGNLYVTGTFYQFMRFDTKEIKSQGETDVFLAKYAPVGGMPTWVRSFGGEKADRITSMSVGKDGNVLLNSQLAQNSNRTYMPYCRLGSFSLSKKHRFSFLSVMVSKEGNFLWTEQHENKTGISDVEVRFLTKNSLLRSAIFIGDLDFGNETFNTSKKTMIVQQRSFTNTGPVKESKPKR